MAELPFHLVIQLSFNIVIQHGIFTDMVCTVEMNDGNGPSGICELKFFTICFQRKDYTIFSLK